MHTHTMNTNKMGKVDKIPGLNQCQYPGCEVTICKNVTLGGKQGEVCEESIISCNCVIIYHYFRVSFKNTENLIDRQQERECKTFGRMT